MEFITDGNKDRVEFITVDDAAIGTRSDVYIGEQLGISRSNAQKLLENGLVEIGVKKIKANYKVRKGDVLAVTLPEPQPIEAQPENIPLNIIYEDDDVVVLNKERGMVVHPAPGNYSGTLVNALLYHCANLSGINSAIRPGIVHRLDKDTSGVMIVAKNDNAHIALSEQIQSKTAARTYLAVVRGNIKSDEGTIETQIARDKNDRKKMCVVKDGGRNAITDYKIVERFGKYTLVECKLRTGRTHQIRVHMEHLGYPLVGDPKYSPMKTPFAINGQALHSQTLEFIHPKSGEKMSFAAEMPEDMKKIITRLHNGQF